ncbi:MAG: antirestriction protein ArdA [Dysosmobacter sp.]|nr:antirestriction protein ArdA [Dysosmobacter sp.]
MDKVFHIRALNSSDGAFREVELDLPATDYELLDLMEQLQLENGKRPYMEIHTAEEYSYLNMRIQEPDLFPLNALAKRLAELNPHGMAAFEGLVCMDLQKGKQAIPIASLINYAHSGECCHVVEDAVTDDELGRFLVENGFVPETDSLPDAALKLLDYTQIGKTHREAEGGSFTSFGYVERHAELPHIYEAMDFQSCKPSYTVLLNIGPFPNVNTPGSRPKPIPVQIPASDTELQDVLARLGKANWTGVMAAILDCPVPSMNKRLFLEEEIPQVIEWAKALQTLDKEGSLPKYKALINAADCEELTGALRFTGALDEYEFAPTLHTEEDVAEAYLAENLSGELLQAIRSHVNLWKLGKSLLEASNGALTPYGSIGRKDRQPIQEPENQPRQGGMEMS